MTGADRFPPVCPAVCGATTSAIETRWVISSALNDVEDLRDRNGDGSISNMPLRAAVKFGLPDLVEGPEVVLERGVWDIVMNG